MGIRADAQCVKNQPIQIGLMDNYGFCFTNKNKTVRGGPSLILPQVILKLQI